MLTTAFRFKGYFLGFAVVLELILSQLYIAPGWTQAPVISPDATLKSSETAPSPIEVQLSQARELRERNDFAAAIGIYLKILQEAPQQRQAREELALSYAFNQEYEKSIVLYKALMAEEPESIELQQQLARVTSWKGDLQQAISLYEAILTQDPNNLAASLALAEVLSWSGELQKAISLYHKALAQFPQSPELRLRLAHVYHSQKKFLEAIEVLQPLIDSKNKEALQLLEEIQAVHITTEFRSNRNNFGQGFQSIQQNTRFRINNSNTVENIKTGFTSFEQPNFAPLNNTTIEIAIEGNIKQVGIRGAVGADLFNRLPAVPRFNTEISTPISPDITLSGVLDYGAYKSNVKTLENQITAVHLGPNLYWQIDPNTSLFSLYRWGSYNDGNQEQQFLLKLERKLGQFFIAASLFNWSYAKDPQNGYFAPPDFLVYTGELGWEGNLFKSLRCRFSTALGRQRLRGEFTRANTYQARCIAQISPSLEAELGYGYNNVRDQNHGGSAYNERTLIGQLRFSF